KVDGTDFDFREKKLVGDIKEKTHPNLLTHKGYDSCFVFDKNKENKLILEHNKSGRTMEIETTYPAVVIYSFNGDWDIKFDEGRGVQHGGFAIEPQYVPNAINRKDFDQPITGPNKDYFEKIIYSFNVI
ncbi:MAG: hypothetical protein ACK5LT_09680, partial [Lachnospirales bacterium]